MEEEEDGRCKEFQGYIIFQKVVTQSAKMAEILLEFRMLHFYLICNKIFSNSLHMMKVFTRRNFQICLFLNIFKKEGFNCILGLVLYKNDNSEVWQ